MKAEFEPPIALDRLMGYLQGSAAPCALFLLGVTVALRRGGRVPWEVPVLGLIKLVVHPAIALVKTVDPVSGHPGDVVTYSFQVTNTGDTPLEILSTYVLEAGQPVAVMVK